MTILLPIVAAVALTSASVQSDAPQYAKGDVVQLQSRSTGESVPDSRVIAVAGDRITADKSGIAVNGERVPGVSPELLEQFAKRWEQVVPAGHYYVIGERHERHSTVRFHGLIPAARILRKVAK